MPDAWLDVLYWIGMELHAARRGMEFVFSGRQYEVRCDRDRVNFLARQFTRV